MKLITFKFLAFWWANFEYIVHQQFENVYIRKMCYCFWYTVPCGIICIFFVFGGGCDNFVFFFNPMHCSNA